MKTYNPDFAIQLNFKPYMHIKDVADAYELLRINGRSNKTYLRKVYKVYLQEKDTPRMALELINNINMLRYIVGKYNISPNEPEKIKELLEKIDSSDTSNIPIKQSASCRKGFYFKEDEIDDCFKFLKPMDNKTRVFTVVDMVMIYAMSGYDEKYLEIHSEELLKSLAALYQHTKSDKTIDSIIRIISLPFDREYLPDDIDLSTDIFTARRKIADSLLEE